MKMQEIFAKRRINLHICLTHEEAQVAIKSLIEDFYCNYLPELATNSEIAFSDSVTLHQLDIYKVVKEMSKELNITTNNPFERFEDGKLKTFGPQPEGRLNLPKDEYVSLQKKWLEQLRTTMLSDILIIGANAIPMTGEIISTDGAGNRVAGMIFGPRRVIIVVGRNKIVPSIEAGINRNRNIAAPLNYVRYNEKHHSRYDTPCLNIGKCVNCNSPRRACLNTVIVSGAVEAQKDRIHVVLVNDDFGL